MPAIRKITKVWQSQPTVEGAGVHLHRAFGNYQVPQFDPFLLLDDFRGDNPADYLQRISLASPSGHRNHYLHVGRRG